MEWWHAVVLGLVEGITEYLPISSTGHLILTRDVLGLGQTPDAREAIDTFSIVVQGGAILAVLSLYWPTVVQMLRGLVGKDPAGLRLAINLIVAFLPAAVMGLALEKAIDENLFSTWAVLLALFFGGVYMLVVSLWARGRIGGLRKMRQIDDVTQVTMGQAFTIGLLQCIAMWPGTSRSMMTITGGLFVGLSPRAAAQFSFLLGLPTLGAACLYKLAKNLAGAAAGHHPSIFTQLGWVPCILGVVVATISAAVAVRWLVGFLTRHGLAPFGWYRIGLTLVMLALLTTGTLKWEGAGQTPARPTPEPARP